MLEQPCIGQIADDPETRTIGVFAIDASPVFLEGLKAIIGQSYRMELRGTAVDGLSALAKMEAQCHDVTVLDPDLPDIHGFEIMKRVRAKHPAARFLVLAQTMADEHLYRAVQAGARGVLSKNASGEEIERHIALVHAGDVCLSPGDVRRMAQRIACESLTKREVEVLHEITLGSKNAQIADRLFICESTVKGHISQILRKLGAQDRTEAVLLGLKKGLVTL